MNDVIVIGAGLAGLAAARELAASGLQVKVLEKSRGVGGRMATRRVQTVHGEVLVDHGAQYFTCRSPRFRTFVEPLLAAGKVKVWFERVPTLTPKGIEPADDQHVYARYCCADGMNTVGKALARDLDIQLETRVESILACNGSRSGWQVITSDGACYEARALLLTPPPHQSLALLGPGLVEEETLSRLRGIDFAPCIAVMAGYEPSAAGMGIPDGLRWHDDPIVSWSAVDSSKRTDPAAPVLVVHTTPEFSRHHWEEDLQDLAHKVLEHCDHRLRTFNPPTLHKPEWLQVQRWRFSMPVNPLEQAWIGSPTPAPLLFAGCWCCGARVEGAFLSGQAAGRALLENGWLT